MRKSLPFTKLMVIIFILCMILPSTLSVNSEQASNIQVDALGNPIDDSGLSPLIDPPTLYSPSNGATITDDTPILDWNYVFGSIRYRIQVDDDSDFSSMEFNEITDVGTGSTTYIQCCQLNDDTYYWRVRSYNDWGIWSAWSSEWHFNLDSTGPNPPTLYSPSYGSTIYDSTPYLDWGSSSTAVLYRVQVDDSSGFGSPIFTATTSSTYDYCTATLSNKVWYWHVQARDSLGNWGDYSSYKYFRVDTTPPSLNSPYNGYLTQSSTLTLSWHAKSTASAYNIQVDDNPSFSSPYSYNTAGTSRTFTLSSDTWYWRVRAQDYRGSWGSFSSYRYFTIDNIPPGIPTLFAPTDGTMTNDQTPYLDWSTVATANLYHVQVDNNADFSSPNLEDYPTSSSYTCTTLSDDTYYWHVCARDAAGNWGEWSATWHFEIDTTPPATLTLLTPSNNSIDSDPTPYLEWSSVTGAVLYQLQIDNDTDFLSLTLDLTTPVTDHITSTLADDVYYWRVRAKDGAENWGDWSDVWNFQVDTTAPEITDVVFDNAPTDLDVVFVYCNVTDSNGLDVVTLHYRVNSGVWTNVTMIWAVDNQYDVNLGTFAYDDFIEFFISANDTCINPNIAIDDNGGSYYNFTVVSGDITGPTISNISHTPDPANDTETITISCDVTDTNGIQSVTLYYRINGGSWTDVSMVFDSGDTYEVTIGSFAYADEIEYYIVAVDDSPNHNEATDDNSGSYYSFIIEASDIDGPTIENISHQPATPTELDTIAINCSVTDLNGVQYVFLYYRIDYGDWMNISMTNIVGSTYNATIGAFDYADIIEYYILAVDDYVTHNIATDDNGGSYYSFTIGASDVSGPTITDIVHTPTNPTDAETVAISCSVVDDSGVQSVTLYYRVNSGSWTDVSMTLTSGSTYEVTIGSFAYADDIEYYINATDSYITHNTAKNDNSGAYYTFTVGSSDVTAPTISDIEYNPNSPSDIDLVNITCTVTDLNGIDSVVLHYRTNGGTWTTTTMLLISGNQYKTTIGTFTAADLVEFYITATDDSPNTNTATDDNGGAYYSFTVLAQSTSNTSLLYILPLITLLGLVVLRRKKN